MHWLRTLVTVAALAASIPALAQLVPGKDYRPVTPPQPTESGKRVEVLEFFWYGCPHCANLQGPLRAWLKQKPADVEFRRVPAVLSDGWVPLTSAYYALEALGVVDKLHYGMFTAIHDQKVRLNDTKVLFDWVAKQGVDRQKFTDTYNSFGVKSRTQRSIEMSRNYDISGTPAIVVDGRYLLSPSLTLRPDNTIDYDRFFHIVNQAIAQARKGRSGK